MPANDTLGEITSDELAELKRHAKTCTTCGMVATVDPVLHLTRYRHAPIIREGNGTLIWSAEAAMFVPHTHKCAACAAEIPAGDTHCQRCGPTRTAAYTCEYITVTPSPEMRAAVLRAAGLDDELSDARH